MYLKQYRVPNPYTGRTAEASYHAELTALCRLAATKLPCRSRVKPADFPTVVFRNDTNLLLGTRIEPPLLGSSTVPLPIDQLRCLWQTLQQAGVLHRDVKCSNTVLSPSGLLTLLDFDSAHNFGDSKSEFYGTAKYNSRSRFFAPHTFDGFAAQLRPCFNVSQKAEMRLGNLHGHAVFKCSRSKGCGDFGTQTWIERDEKEEDLRSLV